MKIRTEFEVFDDPEFCADKNGKCDFLVAGICHRFGEKDHPRFMMLFQKGNYYYHKCNQCKEAYQKAKSSTDMPRTIQVQNILRQMSIDSAWSKNLLTQNEVVELKKVEPIKIAEEYKSEMRTAVSQEELDALLGDGFVELGDEG